MKINRLFRKINRLFMKINAPFMIMNSTFIFMNVAFIKRLAVSYSFCCTSISWNVSMMSPCWMSLKFTSEMPHSKFVATSLTSSL